MSLPSGRAAFLERLNTLMAVESKEPQTPPIDPLDQLRNDVLSRWGDQLELMELYGDGEQQTLLVVSDRRGDDLRHDLTQQLQTLFPDQTPQLKLLDRDAFATIRELIEAGILNTNQGTARTLYRETAADRPKDDGRSRRLNKARERLVQGEHKWRMAKVLIDGGFSIEAFVPMHEAVETALQALILWQGHDADTPPDVGLIDTLLVKANLLPTETLSLIAHLRENQAERDEAQLSKLLAQSDRLFSHATSVLASAGGN
jgi:hypothetical protein